MKFAGRGKNFYFCSFKSEENFVNVLGCNGLGTGRLIEKWKQGRLRL